MQPDQELEFRRAMSAYATGVTVVTAARPDGRISGITVNSLTSVSLSPRLLLWCLGDRSARYPSFAEAEIWGVSVLSAAEEDVAERFTRAEAETASPEETRMLAGAPVLNAGLAHFACRTFDRRIAGDHLIIVGEVLALDSAAGDTLTYFRGRYGRAADPRGE